MAPSISNSRLFQPLTIGTLPLQHRLVMAPLTRYRASDNHVHTPMGVEYYAQRASVPGTLIINEATFISPRGAGFRNIPGVWNKEQIEAWQNITKAVHERGSYIFLQLWALGRAANPDVLEEEKDLYGGNLGLVSSSATPLRGEGKQTPRELTKEEIKLFVGDYAQAAKNAIEAGFDGVEIHGANGYLIDQFTQDVSNKRTDEYGGSVENRSRFGLEVTKAVVDAIGAEKTGIRLSPFSGFQDMGMSDPIPQFSHLVRGLKELNLAFLHLVESRISGNADVESTETLDPFLDIWDNQSPVLVAGGFTANSAISAADVQYKDKDVAIVFGRYFISNPDLPFRLKEGIPLTKYNRPDFYTVKSAKGYTDYPFSEEWNRQSQL